jgi:hypothetical protein
VAYRYRGGVWGFKPPSKFMVSTTHKCISLIYVLIKTKLSSMGKKCFLLIFKQIIRPILTYACPVWGNCASSHIKKMQIVQYKVLRIIANVPWFVRNPNLLLILWINYPLIFFPNIWYLMSILITLPVSTASSERSFSILKRLKSCLRKSTSENRLTGLSHVNSSKYFNKHWRSDK